jgi:hypothetical protein
MSNSWLDADLAVLLVLGLGGPLLGVTRCLGWRRLGAGLAVVLLLGSLVAFAAGAQAKVWLAAGGLAGAYLNVAAAGRYRETLLRLLASPRAGLLLLAAGPALAGAWACWCESESMAPGLVLTPRPGPHAPVPDPIPVAMSAYTDSGHTIPLFTRPVDELPADALGQTDHALICAHPEALIRTSPPDPTYNCHGWVFADGRFWVRNEAVESILADNAYQVVTKPQAGDVVVYRDQAGHVTHSGLVRVAATERPIVESKWGHAGRFLHPVGEQSYGETWAFYRSSRKGHLVRIGDSPLPADGIAE